jgi:hypothetical protein
MWGRGVVSEGTGRGRVYELGRVRGGEWVIGCVTVLFR